MTTKNQGDVSDSAHPAPTEDAAFLGWQKIPRGDLVALYRVTAAGHPSYGSTVSDKTLLNLNLRIPEIQSAEKQLSKKR